MVFTKPVRKKRNFKSLSLAVPETATPAAPGGSALGAAPPSTLQLSAVGPRRPAPPPLMPTNSAPMDIDSERGMVRLADSVLPLELGVELRLDLREEDLLLGKAMGEGAGGTVTLATHRPTQTPMAVKFIRADYNIRQQILKELQILHECNSPYIVSFYGAYPKDNGVHVCMEFMDLRSFERIYRQMGPIPIPV
ncbi:MAP kinase kinase (MEK), partial [Coemansia sp. RSA 2559]